MKAWYQRGVAMAATAALLFAAAACGGGGGGGGGDDCNPSDAQPSSGGEINWWHIQDDGPLLPVWEELSAEFDAQNSDINFAVEPQANEAFKSRLTTAMQANDPPDLFQSWGGGVLRQQVCAGLVLDITDLVEPWIDVVSPGALSPYVIDDRVYGVPWDMGMVGFWYNKALFAQAGISAPPSTWTEFLDAVRALQGAGITPIALAGQDRWPGHFYWTYLVMRVAGLDGLLAAAEAKDFSGPDFVRAGELLQELVALEPFQTGFLAAEYGEEDGQAFHMGQGNTAMELMGQWAPAVQVAASGTDGLGDDLGFFPFPAVEGGKGAGSEIMGGGNGFAVGVNAPAETVEFLRYILEAHYDRVKATDAVVTVLAADVEGSADPNMALVLEGVSQATGFQLYLDQDYPPAVGEEIKDAVAALIAGNKTAEGVVQDINAAWSRE